MIEPVGFEQVFYRTSTLLVPTSTGTASPTALPTIIPPTYQTAGDTGHQTLLVVTVIMTLSTVAFIGLAWSVPVQKRLFHVLTAFITTLAAISYFAMASGAGVSYAYDDADNVYRQVYWARYIDWSVTTPLLLLDLAFLAGLDGASIIVAIFADVVMILTGLFAAFGTTDTQKWGFYAISCAAFLVIIYELVVPGRRAVASKSGSTAQLFASIGGFTLVLWTLYPIVWGISDGAKKWSVDSEIVAYAILDVLAKPIFGFWLLFAHAKNASAIEGFWSHGLSSEGALRIGDDE